jgi:putative ABC transport system permease protein
MKLSRWIKDFGPKSRAQMERELEREIHDHLSLEAEESGQHGAQRAFGNTLMVKEDVREAWGWAGAERFLQDVRYGLRQVQRSPGFSLIAIATLALGIGANAAMFSVVDAVLVRPLPYADSDRLVMVWEDASNIAYARGTPAPGTWQEWRRENSAFTDIAATRTALTTLSGDGEPEQLQGRRVTANFWIVLGSQPALGRVFTEDEDTHGAPVAVISHGLWQRRFGGSRDIIGRKIIANGSPFEIVGVMPPGFYFLPGREIEIWMPVSFSARDLSNFGSHYLQCVARLKPGVSFRQASDSMIALSLRVAERRGEKGRKALVVPLREELAGKTETSLLVLLCASLAILLISCVNLANLLLSRGAARKREIALRVALGAGRGRLVAQFLTESVVLSGFGAVAGLALASPAMAYLETLVPQTMLAVHLSLDWRILGFSMAIAVAATLVFGLAPALGMSRLDPQDGLKEGGRGSTGVHRSWLQNSLIIAETALAVALLTSGGLLLQTLQHLERVNLGLRTEKLLTMVTPLFRFRDPDRRVGFVDSMLERMRAVPGVVSASATCDIPLSGSGGSAPFLFAGEPMERYQGRDALARIVTRDYFTTIGARLREGRFFGPSDRAVKGPAAELVAIVNETFADRSFPGRSALGVRFKFSDLDADAAWYTIVGVVKEIRERGVAAELKPAVYALHEQAAKSFTPPSGLIIRTSVEPESIVTAVREAIRSVDKNEPVARIRTMDAIVASELAEPSKDTALFAAFAALALTLACIGLYGVLSYRVTQRTNEVGVRMALGATSTEILLFFAGRGLALTLIGLGSGLVLAIVAARLMSSLLFGFHPDYVPVFAAVAVVLFAVAVLACFVPARRASRVDPMIALRHE